MRPKYWFLQPQVLPQRAALLQPKLLLVLLTGALGCSSLFAVFTYITPLLEDITGFSESAVAWILVLFGVGVTTGNIVGGKLADWKLMPSLLVNFAFLALILAVFAYTVHVPALASTSNHSALNLGNAFGAFIGGAIITNVGLSYLPWFGALFSFLGLLLAGAVYMWDIKDGKRVTNR